MHRVEFNECKWLFSCVFRGALQNTQRYTGFCTSSKNSPIGNCLRSAICSEKNSVIMFVFNGQTIQFLKCAADRSVLCATHNDMPRIYGTVSERKCRPGLYTITRRYLYLLAKYTHTSAALERRTRKKAVRPVHFDHRSRHL